jgi:hypothetical protein
LDKGERGDDIILDWGGVGRNIEGPQRYCRWKSMEKGILSTIIFIDKLSHIQLVYTYIEASGFCIMFHERDLRKKNMYGYIDVVRMLKLRSFFVG